MSHPKITNTKDVSSAYIKVLVHGPAGSGKTRLCATTGGKPIIISAESGLLSLRGNDLDVWEIKTINDLREAYAFLTDDKAYDWICIDSISEIAEVCLAEEKVINKDPRKAYGELTDTMNEMVRLFRDLHKNIYMSSKQDKVKDETTGQIFFGPSAPGQKVAAAMPYFFDEVFALHTWKDAEGKMQSGLQTQRDTQYEAKDRSGALDIIEPPNLAHIYNKILTKLNGVN